MYFQTLDDKAECVGIYANNQLFFDSDKFPQDVKYTWKYAPYLRDLDIEYVSLYLEGGSIGDAIPEYLRDDWEDVSKKINAFKRSLALAQVDTLENCFFDLVPQRFLVEFCEVKNKITEYVRKNIERPKRYEFYKHVSMMLEDLNNRPIHIDKQTVLSYTKVQKLKNQANTLITCDPVVRYNQFGTKTGRLTTKKGSFPILTLNKEFRSAIKPQNDFYLELDFNGAEVRTLLGLLGKDQPLGDVHNFHLDQVFTETTSRETAKTSFFAWLYGSRTAVSKENADKLSSFYEKSSLLDEYWDGDTVTTPFGKQIPNASAHHALNYLVQSTAAELTLKQSLKADYLLRERSSGSHIAFLIHDAIVIDMKKEDEHLIRSLIALMSSTNFGKFVVNVKKGKSLGSLKGVNIG